MYQETIFKYYGYIGRVGADMLTQLYPPTPNHIEGMSLDQLFKDPQMEELLREIQIAIYFLANPHITPMEKMGNWNAINSRLKVLKDTSIGLRSMIGKPQVKKYDINSMYPHINSDRSP